MSARIKRSTTPAGSVLSVMKPSTSSGGRAALARRDARHAKPGEREQRGDVEDLVCDADRHELPGPQSSRRRAFRLIL
jgi:hypothetical protein